MTNEGFEPHSPGIVVRDRYRIEAVVGRGGLGTVYRVSDVIYGKGNIYALKELSDPSPGARKQFLLECQWLQALDHNHIPKVRENFEWEGRLYLVMDFVAGDNLEQTLMRNGGRPLPERQVLRWMLPVCDALQYLHTRMPPILHRDVKPANIIISPAGYPVLVDFGIAKEHLPGANQTATFVRKAGTEGYAPPEQYTASNQTGPWSDVYGTGATLFHLLTGAVPPTAVERIVDARLPHLRELNPAISMTTDAAVWKALTIRPNDRYQSIADFAQPLMEALRMGERGANSNPNSNPYPGFTASHPSTPSAYPAYPSTPPMSSAPATGAIPPAMGGGLRASADTQPAAQPGAYSYPPLGPDAPASAPRSSRLYGDYGSYGDYGDGSGPGAGPISPAPRSPLPASRPSPARPITSAELTGNLRAPSAQPVQAAQANGYATAANLPRPQTAARIPVTRDDLAIDLSAFPRETAGPARKGENDPEERSQRRLVAPLAIGAGLVALVVVIVLLAPTLIQMFAPLDQSTPQATITGYFAAVKAQNANRAWQYTSNSRNNPGAQTSFTNGLQSDNAQYGTVVSARILSVTTDNAGHADVTAQVTRSRSPTPITYTLVLTQYGGDIWLIDTVAAQ